MKKWIIFILSVFVLIGLLSLMLDSKKMTAEDQRVFIETKYKQLDNMYTQVKFAKTTKDEWQEQSAKWNKEINEVKFDFEEAEMNIKMAFNSLQPLWSEYNNDIENETRDQRAIQTFQSDIEKVAK